VSPRPWTALPPAEVALRPLRRDDLPLLTRWLQAPHVREWWRDEPTDLTTVEAKYGSCIDGDDPTELFIIEAGGRTVGMIQRYRFADEPVWRQVLVDIADVETAAGFDYLLGERDAVGQGIGTATVRQLVVTTFGQWPVDSIVVTVQQANVASWRVLEKAGFSRVWAGELASPDASDEGPEYVYVMRRAE
jgi:aminoglycoside 6'-N-acetyltransferase